MEENNVKPSDITNENKTDNTIDETDTLKMNQEAAPRKPQTEPAPKTDPDETADTPQGPEINLPGTEAGENAGIEVGTNEPKEPDIGLPPRPNGPQKLDASAKAESSNYRWTYGDELRHNNDSKRRRSSGVLTYAIIMTIVAALCFTLLLGVVMYENGKLNLGATRTIYVREYDKDSGVLTIAEIAEKVKPSVVGITVEFSDLTGSSVGTGIVMTADGYISTNYHVIENGSSVVVTLSNNAEYAAEVIGYDELSDLAVLKINATGLTPAEFGNSNDLIVGELAVAIGNPAGLEYAGTVTDGIISAINRNVKIYDDTGVMVKKMTLIQTNATVNPGNSGGPLVDEYGKVIGIVTMKLANDYDGIGFAIPSDGALTILNEIIQTGSSGSSSQIATKRAIIGITAGGVSAGSAYTLEDGTTGTADISGVMITIVSDGFDVTNKLKVGDIITKVDGKEVLTVYDVMDIVNDKYAGDSISVTYYRGGEYNTVTVVLGSE